MLTEANESSKLPLRWKIFRVINFIQAFFSTAIVLYIVIFLIDFKASYRLILQFLYAFGFSVAAVNNFFNIHLLAKYFPGKPLPIAKEKTAMVLLIPYVLLTLMMLLFGVTELMSEINDTGNSRSIMILGLFTACNLLGVYIFIQQASLIAVINQNNKKEMRRMTKEIGSS